MKEEKQDGKVSAKKVLAGIGSVLALMGIAFWCGFTAGKEEGAAEMVTDMARDLEDEGIELKWKEF
jgi:hypothetical protein